MSSVLKKGQIKNILESSAKIIYDDVAQNLCLAKLLLAGNSNGQPDIQEANNTRCIELVSSSITLLRKVADSLNEINIEVQTD